MDAVVTQPEPATAIGAITMALGIFIAGPLQRIPGGGEAILALTCLLLLIWITSASRLLLSFRRAGLQAHTNPIVRAFGIGTWVAGTAIVARASMLTWPAAGWAAITFFAASFAIWLAFMALALTNLARLLVHRNLRANGSILLATVATESVALVALRLFSSSPAIHAAAVVLMGIGALLYVAGISIILRRYGGTRNWSLRAHWHNSNCIIHGALSITGLTAVVSGSFDAQTLLAFWSCDLIVFALVEAVEVARLWSRIQTFGMCGAAFGYRTSQWARNFTFGMFYVFTFAYVQRFGPGNAYPWLSAI